MHILYFMRALREKCVCVCVHVMCLFLDAIIILRSHCNVTSIIIYTVCETYYHKKIHVEKHSYTFMITAQKYFISRYSKRTRCAQKLERSLAD